MLFWGSIIIKMNKSRIIISFGLLLANFHTYARNKTNSIGVGYIYEHNNCPCDAPLSTSEIAKNALKHWGNNLQFGQNISLKSADLSIFYLAI